MTEQDAIENIQEMGKLGDIEGAHCLVDALVSKALRQLGWPDFADAYDKARRDWWYA